jgi:hypothetical protein
VELQDAHLDHREEAFERGHRAIGLARPVTALLDLHPPDGFRELLAHVLLVEALLLSSLGAADEGERPVLQVGEDPRLDPVVVGGEVALGEPRRGVEHLVRVAQPHAGDGGLLLRLLGGGSAGAGLTGGFEPASVLAFVVLAAFAAFAGPHSFLLGLLALRGELLRPLPDHPLPAACPPGGPGR